MAAVKSSCFACVIMALGDGITQMIEMRSGELKEWNAKRTGRFALVGLTLHGPFFYYGFARIESIFGSSKSARNVLAKVVTSQLTLFPTYISLFFPYISLLEGKSPEQVVKKTKTVWWPTFRDGALFWPAVNTINFLFVPPGTTRVLCVSTAGLLSQWDDIQPIERKKTEERVVALSVYLHQEPIPRIISIEYMLTISVLNERLATENHVEASQYGFLFSNKDQSIEWIHHQQTAQCIYDRMVRIYDLLNFCTHKRTQVSSTNSQLQWRKKLRPVKLLTGETTFRTHLIDDSSPTSKIIEVLSLRFGFNYVLDATYLDAQKYEILNDDSSLRSLGFLGDVKLGMFPKDIGSQKVPQKSEEIMLAAVVPFCEDKVKIEVKNKWKRFYAVLRKERLILGGKMKIEKDLSQLLAIAQQEGKNHTIKLTWKDNTNFTFIASSSNAEKLWRKELHLAMNMFATTPIFFQNPKGYLPVAKSRQNGMEKRKSCLRPAPKSRNKKILFNSLRSVSKFLPKFSDVPMAENSGEPEDDSGGVVFERAKEVVEPIRRNSFDVTELLPISQSLTVDATDMFDLSDTEIGHVFSSGEEQEETDCFGLSDSDGHSDGADSVCNTPRFMMKGQEEGKVELEVLSYLLLEMEEMTNKQITTQLIALLPIKCYQL